MNWEDHIDKEYNDDGYLTGDTDDLKAFIKHTLQADRQHLLKAVEEMAGEPFIFHPGIVDPTHFASYQLEGFRYCRDKVIELLNASGEGD
jgi:hypothetical protein